MECRSPCLCIMEFLHVRCQGLFNAIYDHFVTVACVNCKLDLPLCWSFYTYVLYTKAAGGGFASQPLPIC